MQIRQLIDKQEPDKFKSFDGAKISEDVMQVILKLLELAAKVDENVASFIESNQF